NRPHSWVGPFPSSSFPLLISQTQLEQSEGETVMAIWSSPRRPIQYSGGPASGCPAPSVCRAYFPPGLFFLPDLFRQERDDRR
uniref:Uncharacterized protein n=3 Tax=Aegilops tauschii subsp. strangulata TaxID=200361 RepID=A0A453D1W5_AEGTS